MTIQASSRVARREADRRRRKEKAQQAASARSSGAFQGDDAPLAEAQRTSPLGSWDWDIASDTVTWSDQLCDMFGLSADTVGITFERHLMRIDARDRRRVEEIVAAALRDGSGFEVEHRTAPVDEAFKWLHSRGQVVRDTEGNAKRIRGTAQDITALRRATEKIQSTGEFDKAVLDNMTDMVVACDADGRITIVNRAMALALDIQTPLGAAATWTDLGALYYPDGTALAPEDHPMSRALRGEDVRDLEIALGPTPSALRRRLIANGRSFLDAQGRMMGAVVIARDITKQREAQASVSYAALHDPVTGMANMALFVERLLRVLDLARRKRWSTTLLTVDLDNFRYINERVGRGMGDEVLAEVARRLEDALRTTNTRWHPGNATRLGGDQFFLICERVPNEQAAESLAHRIKESLSFPVVVSGHAVTVSACVGITIDRDSDHAPDQLIVEAEAAMRRAKERGPGHHALFAEQMRARLVTRVESEADLRRALEEGELRVVYQPKILLSTGRMVGVEALLRWEHPDKGSIPPLDFIPLAEDTGLIVPIGLWVLRQACADARRWNAAAPPVVVSVNVSGRQFEVGLVEMVASVIASTGTDPATLCLEITESVVMENAEFTIEILQRLRALGVRISIDDFGTGYSSLAYLRRFPLDELKIDRSFVEGLGRDPEATAVAAAVMGMAHALNLTVVAEGVETVTQDAALRALGCDEAQGFLYSRPQSAKDLEPFLEKEHVLYGTESSAPGNCTLVVIDDAADIRQLARASLTAAGFAVHEASGGVEGLALCRRVIPDCVILDVRMPGIDGLAVCRALRADPLTRDITIVMLTVAGRASDKVEAFILDVDDYIVKPFAPRDLVRRVTVAMRRRRGEDAR
ncbi:MAG: EAL domain-containing protein [Candidatus Dormibacteria bacterium]